MKRNDGFADVAGIDRPQSRNVKKDTFEIIENALLSYAYARSSLDACRERDKGSDTTILAEQLRKIRGAQMSLRGAYATISAMRMSPWREAMKSHLKSWEGELDEIWMSVVDSIDE